MPFGAGEDRLEQLPLLLEDAVDPLLDRLDGEEPRDGHGGDDADAVGTVDRLVLDGRVPPAIEQEHVLGELEVQPHAAGPVADQQQVRVRVFGETADYPVALPRRDLAVILQRLEPLEPPGKLPERLDPLAEHQRLAPAGGHFLQVGLQALQLRAGPGGRIEVADLLQAEHQLEDVLDADQVLHGGQAQDALALGQLVALALLGAQLQLGVAEQLGRQVGEHLVLGPAQHVVADRAAHAPRPHVRREEARGKELEDPHQVLRAVFHGGAGQGPASASGDGAGSLVGGACAVLDPLRLVQHDQVEAERRLSQVLAAGDHLPVAVQELVVGDFDRHVGKLPLPAAPGLVPLDRHHRDLRGPEVEFPQPAGHQRLGTNQQDRADLAAAQQQADRGDRLHGLAQPHLVGQDRRVPGVEERDAGQLVPKRLEGKRQRPLGQQPFQRRLEDVAKPVFQLNHVLGWLHPGAAAGGEAHRVPIGAAAPLRGNRRRPVRARLALLGEDEAPGADRLPEDRHGDDAKRWGGQLHAAGLDRRRPPQRPVPAGHEGDRVKRQLHRADGRRGRGAIAPTAALGFEAVGGGEGVTG